MALACRNFGISLLTLEVFELLAAPCSRAAGLLHTDWTSEAGIEKMTETPERVGIRPARATGSKPPRRRVRDGQCNHPLVSLTAIG
jgi:hypothetical protein